MRQRIKRAKGAIIASSDFNHVKASREVLSAGHEERMTAINMMTFSANPTLVHHGRPYVKVWGKKTYIPTYKADALEQCGMKVYWE